MIQSTAVHETFSGTQAHILSSPHQVNSLLFRRIQITDYKMAPKGAPVNGANLGSMGFKLSTKLINKLIIIR
jgi:hypothetical protein